MEEVLFLAHRLPFPPTKGCRVRAFHLLRALAVDHRVHLLTFADDGQTAAEVAPLRELCATVEAVALPARRAYLRCAANAWRRRPFTLSYFHSRALARRVGELATRNLAGVFAYSSSMVPYALAAGPVPKLLDMVDVDSEKWRQYARRGPWALRPLHAVEAARMRVFEADAVASFDCVTLATERDAALLASFAPHPAIRTLRNGIDTDYFRPVEARGGPPTLVFTGQMDYLPNIDAVVGFARGCLPRLRARFPDLTLLIVGRHPVPTVRALAALPGVTVTGEVDDVRPFLARGTVFIAPLSIAQGVQNKVLEAMACGLPVVCSPRVLAGLDDGSFVPGEDLVAAEPGVPFADAVERLLRCPEERARLGVDARRRVARYSWEHCTAELQALWSSVVERRTGGAATAVAGGAGGA